MSGPLIDVRRAADRFLTRTGWLESWRSFSFAEHYDPDNTGHGLLVAHNEEVLRPGTGFDPHPHRDTEIVTWVLAGGLVHEDSTGHRGLVRPGLAQAMTAGRGVRHSERNDGWHDGPEDPAPVRYVQVWLRPDEPGLEPAYSHHDVDDLLSTGELVPVVSGDPSTGAPVRIRASATLHVARLAGGAEVVLPDAPRLHVFVPRGTARLEGAGDLGTGDAARVSGGGGQRLRAGDDAEVLVWATAAG